MRISRLFALVALSLSAALCAADDPVWVREIPGAGVAPYTALRVQGESAFASVEGINLSDSTIAIRSAADGKLIKNIATFHGGSTYCISRDGHFYARWTNWRFQVWDLGTRKLLGSAPAAFIPLSADIAPTGRVVCQTLNDGVQVFDLDTEHSRLTRVAALPIYASFEGSGIKISPDGSNFSLDIFPWFQVYDSLSGSLLGRLHSSFANHQYLSDGRIALNEAVKRTEGWALRYRILAPGSTQVLSTVRSPASTYYSKFSAISDDGTRVVFGYRPIGSEQFRIEVRDDQNRLLRVLTESAPWDYVAGGVISPDGSTFVCGAQSDAQMPVLAAYVLP